nr:MAG TPA: RNA dependent RNA polymerase [Caudoviricetes sp.]
MLPDDILVHYGTPRHSGRYPWGSGKDPYQSAKSFFAERQRLRDHGLSDTDIARAWGMSTTEFRAIGMHLGEEKRAGDISRAVRMKQAGLPNTVIAEKMGINESSVRNLLSKDSRETRSNVNRTADILAEQAKKYKYIEYGAGVELNMGCSDATLRTAVEVLKQRGYVTNEVYIKQAGSDKFTTLKVLSPHGTKRSDLMANRDKIRTPGIAADLDGAFTTGIKKPSSISSKRIKVRYDEDGGTDMDGVIQIRRGVKDLSLGNSTYAQVRIAVDGTHYLKGMAMYSDDLPKGVDVVFNTNKKKGTPKLGPKDNTVLKPMKQDPDNPFGATIRKQLYFKGKDGTQKLSAINIVNDEGTWDKWSQSLASQFLSKQSPVLAKKQLAKVRESKQMQYDDIMRLTNPSLRKKLLISLADDCDSASVHLKAKALPGQSSQVILPLPHMKKNEIYAPNYRDGEVVSLVRYPHGGTFEIPQLVVNNRNKKARRTLGQVTDAVGIHPSVAERLSGADFDGDSVVVIPHRGKTRIKATKPLKGLEGFDPKRAYPKYDGMKVMSDTQTQMGKISNLITDMTIKGASEQELARAVRHSMVVIDAEKHQLNYKQSERDNGIAALKKKYQSGGASTLISRASGEKRIPRRKARSAREGGSIDPKTGKKVWVETGESYIDSGGKKVLRTEKAPRMALTDDAYSLSSGTRMENLYAEHANSLKALANKARKEAVSQPRVEKNPQAARRYSREVAELRAQINVARKAKPLERQAQVIANGVVDAKVRSNPDMSYKDRAKVTAMALKTARQRLGYDRNATRIRPTPLQYRAIQEGAVSQSMIDQILESADLDHLKSLAMPKQTQPLTRRQANRISIYRKNGSTVAEIADALGISPARVREYLSGTAAVV